MAWISTDKTSGTGSTTVVASAPDNYINETTPVAERTGTITVRANGDVVAPTTINVRQLGFTPVRPLPDPTVLTWLGFLGKANTNHPDYTPFFPSYPSAGVDGTVYKSVQVSFIPILEDQGGYSVQTGAAILRTFGGQRPGEIVPSDSFDIPLQVDREHMDTPGAVPIQYFWLQIHRYINWDNTEFSPISVYDHNPIGIDYDTQSPPSDNVSISSTSGSIMIFRLDDPATLQADVAPRGMLVYSN